MEIFKSRCKAKNQEISGIGNFFKSVLTRQALGVGATHEALGGGIKLPPLYFSRNISATRKRRSAKLCTHLPEYLAEVMCKFGADPISDDVTVTSEVRL